jgi:imidazole glycerol-phosphate synthase subunit HisH
MPDVTIVDYDTGNLKSVHQAFTKVGADVEVSGDRNRIMNARRLVLPGVGAFANCMTKLRDLELIEPIMSYLDYDRPFLGICVGMQLMMARGEEFGTHQGLGLLSGSVQAISATKISGEPHKVPHIGWSPLARPEGANWSNSIFADLNEGDELYFVHSFAVVPDNTEIVLATTDHNGNKITAAVRRNNAYGCQFHPEKSGAVGLRIINCFANS